MHINENPLREHILSAALQLKEFHPEQIWFFDASGFNPDESDPNVLDFCVVMDTERKTDTMTVLYNEVRVDVPFSILLYTPSEWEKHSQDPGAFASYIRKEGTLLYQKLDGSASE